MKEVVLAVISGLIPSLLAASLSVHLTNNSGVAKVEKLASTLRNLEGSGVSGRGEIRRMLNDEMIELRIMESKHLRRQRFVLIFLGMLISIAVVGFVYYTVTEGPDRDEITTIPFAVALWIVSFLWHRDELNQARISLGSSRASVKREPRKFKKRG